MTSKKRLNTAIERKIPDRLPVTTHHVMPYFLKKYMDGIHYQKFFDHFGLDPILWIADHRPDESKGEYFDPLQKELGFLEARRICSENWRIETEVIPHRQYKTIRYYFITPKKTLSMVLQSDIYTTWVIERLIKDRSDIDLIAEYAPAAKCNVDAVNAQAEEFGERGIVRGFVSFFDVYGQSGCWQDAAVLYGIVDLIEATYEEPEWVHRFLKILFERKKIFIESTQGAKYDILEHGGGDASSTIISPHIFDNFVAPYDSELINIAHQVGQRIVYHTCGGMMPILENIAAMHPDAMETFTPSALGGDTDLLEAKKRIGDKVCMIGGFDQFHYFNDCTPAKTRAAVRKLFEQVGKDGGFILAPSDHFFDADLELIKAFADEGRNCFY
jgi:hypothetical protein